MVFNSLTFILFLAATLGLYYTLNSWRTKKWMLLVASYLFYAAWNPPFVILIWISTVVDWYAAQKISRAATRTQKSVFLALSLTTNLGLLGAFKYGEFLLDNFERLAMFAGISYQAPALDIVLPVGISFYTFQSLSYTIDIYRGEMDPWDSMLDFALFVTFFPQLVAGPIVRAADFLPQLSEPRSATERQFGWGVSLLILGLFEKQVLADRIFAPVADKVYSTGPDATLSMIDSWCGTLAFSGQIFCDFAGYSTCAIGVAMCFGFALPDNFRFPYAATGFRDFWRRWHISLSKWLRDYLYISLGGNRRGSGRTLINLMITMFLGGLWHGAGWTFVVWGLLHGIFLVGERLLFRTLGKNKRWKRKRWQLVGAIITFALVCYAWVFFRADTFSTAARIVGAMSGFHALTVENALDWTVTKHAV